MNQLVQHVGTWLAAAATSKVAVLSLGGAVGVNARYWLAKWLGEIAWAKGFPLGTFVINVSGSFVLGVVAAMILERLPPGHYNWYLLLGTGFCGGFTTFSTFEWETFSLVRDGSLWMALVNIAGSVAAGFAALVAGVALSGLVLPRQ